MNVITVEAVLVGFVFVSPVSAQSFWLAQSQSDENSITVEFAKPNFEKIFDVTTLTSLWFVSGRFAVGKNIVIVGELPLAYGKIDVDGADSETVIGNPYGGIEVRKAGSNLFGELGVRLPITADDKPVASFVGTNGDLDRLEAFVPDLFGIVGRVNYQGIHASNVLIRLRVGPAVLTNADNFLTVTPKC